MVRSQRVTDLIAVFGLALLVRLGLVLLSRGGATGNFGYDAGVYYTSADALIHGRLPYRDFVLLHPPGLMLALTPFATLGRLTTDHAGFVVANTTFAVLGAANAALVTAIGRRLMMPRGAALLGGVFYAVWFGAASSEVSARLEPLGSFLFLVGLWFLTGSRVRSRRYVLAAGLALGAAAAVKIWWVVPLLVVLVWQVRSTGARRRMGWFALGAAGTLVLVAGPFFLAAPSAMWRMVITDQLGRHALTTSPITRLDELSSLRSAVPSLHGDGELGALVVLGVVMIGLGVVAGRAPGSRLLVAILAAQLLVLMAAPTYFSYYAGYPAAALALVVAAAASSRSTTRTGRVAIPAARLTVAAAAVLTVVTLVRGDGSVSQPFPGAQLARRVTHVRCLMADSPMALIELDALSRDLADGCPNWVDVSGRTYDTDASTGAEYLSRTHNRRWQADVRHYLLSGDALIMIRGATGLSPDNRRTLRREPILARSDGVTVYRRART